MNTPGAVLLRVRVGQSSPVLIKAPAATLGRTPENDVVVSHPLVSRRHAAFEWSNGWRVVDRGSTNGIFVDGIRQSTVRVDGTVVIRLGDGETGPLVELSPHVSAPTIVPPSRPTPVQQQPPPGRVPAQPRPAPNRQPRSQRPAPRPTSPQAPPRFGALPDAPHLAALHQNASAVFQVPESLRARQQSIAMTGSQSIGRTPDNDIVVSDVLASRHHARITASAPGLLLEDLGSVNGTFVNGQRVMAQRLDEGDVVTIGNSDFVLSSGQLVRGRPQAQVAGGLQVEGLSLTVDGGKTLVNDVSFRAAPGTLTAIIGPSGAGKSTVSKIVAGLNTPTTGIVTFEDRGVHDEYEALRSRIGMVPQDDVLHHKLTLRQALRYAAELRLPTDLSTNDRDNVIDGVLTELQLTEHVNTRVDKLSGGQRKRASVAMELLTGPSLLILDEPTSGLDPALDQQVMKTLRRLADAGRVVLVVTHSVAHLNLCDQVLLLAPGGKTSFCGQPTDVATELGTTDWAEIFAYVADHPDQAWNQYRTRHPHTSPPPRATSNSAPITAPKLGLGRQTSTVIRRQFRLIWADRGYLAVLALMPIILGVLTLVVPGDKGFTRDGRPLGDMPKDTGEALQILTVLVIGAAFMGTALAVRDLVGERSIFERERAVGLRPGAYLTAKVVALCVVTTVQVAIMLGLTYGVRAVPTADGVTEAGTPYPLLPPALTLGLAIVTVAWVSVLVGLTISAAVRSTEQTMPPLVIVIMVQLVLSGGLIAISAAAVKPLTWLLPTYWAYANAAQAVNLPYIAKDVPQVKATDGSEDGPIMYPLWEPTTMHALISYGALALLTVVLTGYIYSRLRLRRR